MDSRIFIFLSRGHLMLHAMENDVARMCSDRQAGCVASSADSWRWHYLNWRLDRKPKIGAAKSSINEACDGSSGGTSELLLLRHLPAQAA